MTTLSMPLRIERGRAVAVEWGSAEHVAQCVATAARTELGTLEWAPGFGIPSYVLAADGADVDELRAAVVDSVPSAEVVAEEIGHPDDLREQHVRLLVEEA